MRAQINPTLRRAVLFVNGHLADGAEVRRRLLPTDTFIAVDGGLNILQALGLQPHLLIGDFDSIEPDQVEVLRSAGVEIRKFPAEKDETDLELALLAAVAAGFESIWLVAALGGRLDQTLANLALLSLPQLGGRSVWLFDGYEEVFLIQGSAEIHGQPGDLVSLLPQGGPASGITTTGLLYPLRSETLHPQRSRGISNRMLGSLARVEVAEGVLLCIHTLAPSD